MHKLAIVVKRKQNLMESFSLLKQAYEGYSTLLGISHHSTAQSAYSLGIIHILIGERIQAYDYFHIAFNNFKQSLGKSHALTVSAREWEARCYLTVCKAEDAQDTDADCFEWRMNKRCELCGIKFRYFRCHRHHCRVCARTVCHTCSSHSTLVMDYHHRNLVRMCDKCYSQGF